MSGRLRHGAGAAWAAIGLAAVATACAAPDGDRPGDDDGGSEPGRADDADTTDDAREGDDAREADDADDARVDDGADDAGDARDSCPHCECDCFCASDRVSAACCSGGTVLMMGMRYTTAPDGCPCCECYVASEHACAEGCVFYDGADAPACVEDLRTTCGDGWLSAGEECESGPPVGCVVDGCPAPGIWLSCSSLCAVVDPPRCVLSPEACTNGLDDDCDGETDEGCVPECCTDLADDDGDGWVDCADSDCAADAACAPCRPGAEICWDGCDNDLDCRTDAEDEDCDLRPRSCGRLNCAPGPEICDNGCDDDRDRIPDCADVDCAGTAACARCPGTPEDWSHGNCGNGIDDDCDGATDEECGACGLFPTSVERCSSGWDEDMDWASDCEDPDCRCDARCLGIMPEQCDDLVDNDADGLTDADDWDCPRPCT